MKICYSSEQLIVTDLAPDDFPEVVGTLKFLEKLFCAPIDYDEDAANSEIRVYIADYYEYRTLRSKIYDHCNVIRQE